MSLKDPTVGDVPERFQKFEPPEDSGENWIEYNRDRIERLADSDLRSAWVFERLLQSVDEGDS